MYFAVVASILVVSTGFGLPAAAPGNLPEGRRLPGSGALAGTEGSGTDCGIPPDDEDGGGGQPGPGPGPGPDPVPIGFGTDPDEEQPGFVEGADSYHYVQFTGHYQFSKTSPHLLHLKSQEGTVLAGNASFSLESTPATSLSDAHVLTADSSLFSVEANVTTGARVQGTLRVDYAFTNAREPKITPVFNESQGSNLTSYRIRWTVNVDDDYLNASSGGGTTYLPALASPTLVGNSVTWAEVGESSTPAGWRRKLVVDWSDYGPTELWAGPVSAGGGPVSEGVLVKFPAGVSQVDPTIVARSTSWYSTAHNSQRKTFHWDGYYWLFYHDGANLVYRRSADARGKWSPPYTVTDDPMDSGQGWFDVAHVGSRVAVAWGYYGPNGEIAVKVRTASIDPHGLAWDSSALAIYGDDGQDWTGTEVIGLGDVSAFLGPISVAIGTDEAEWVAMAVTLHTGQPVIRVYRRQPGTLFVLSSETVALSMRHALQLLPLNEGRLVLLYVDEDSDFDERYYDGVTWLTFSHSSVGFNGLDGYGTPPSHPEWYFSATTNRVDVVHVAYRRTDNWLGHARLTPPGSIVSERIVGPTFGLVFPSISVDASGALYIAYAPGPCTRYVYLVRNPQGQVGTWLYPERVFTSSDNVGHVTTPAFSSRRLVVAWTTTGCNPSVEGDMWIGTLPLAAPPTHIASLPWQRDGLSPYGYYLSRLATSVSPGTGQLVIRQEDFVLPGLGPDLTLARLYRPPRYLQPNGAPYMLEENPTYDVGDSWTFDLPWLGRLGVHYWGDQMFPYAFDDGRFEVHEAGVHFELRRVSQGVYELNEANGLSLQFDSAPGPPGVYKLTRIEDTDGNALTFLYTNPGGRLRYIQDVTGRRLDLALGPGNKVDFVSLEADGQVHEIVDYVYAGEELRQVVMPGSPSQATSFTYVYTVQGRWSVRPFLETVTFPSGGQVSLKYVALDISTDAKSFYVSVREVLDAPAVLGIRPRISKTTFNYRIVDGSAVYTDVFDYDETRLQLHTNYTFGTPRRPLVTVRYQDPAGTVLREVRNWHSATGEISSQEVFVAGESRPRFATERAYDEWGNVVFSRDAAGKETVYSYANTRSRNAFRVPGRLEEKLSWSHEPQLYDDFSDRGLTEWTAVGQVGLDYAYFLDAPPALNVSVQDGGLGSFVRRSFPSGAAGGEFAVTFMFHGDANGYILSGSEGEEGLVPRIVFKLTNPPLGQPGGGALHALDELRGWVVLKTGLLPFRWYRLAAVIEDQSQYSTYLDGRFLGQKIAWTPETLSYVELSVDGSDRSSVLTQEIYYSTGGWPLIEGLPSGARALYVNRWGKLVGGSEMDMEPGWYPYLMVMVVNARGTVEFRSPVQWIFPHYRFIYHPPVDMSPLSLVTSGLGQSKAIMLSEEDDVPYEDWNKGELDEESTVTEVGFPWESEDPPGAIHGTEYHQSYSVQGAHRHYFDTDDRSVTAAGPASGGPEFLMQYVMPYIRAGRVGFQVKSGVGWTGFTWGLGPQPWILLSDVPPIRGYWQQLLVRCDTAGLCDRPITGWSYEMFNGGAAWDLSAVGNADAGSVRVQLPSGYQVQFFGEEWQWITSATSNGVEARLDLYSAGVHRFPTKGFFRIVEDPSGELVWESPVVDPIWGGDVFAYAGSEFFSNQILYRLRDRQVGLRTWRDVPRASDEVSTYFGYDTDGHLTETKTSKDVGWITESFTYGAWGNLETYTDPMSRETTFTYGTGPGQCWGAYLTLVERWIDGVPVRTRYVWDCVWGRLKSSVTPENEPTNNPMDYSYDDLGRLVTILHPAVEGVRDDIHYVYEDALNRVTIEDEDGRKARYTYDGLGRIKTVERLSLDGVNVRDIGQYRYDHQDRVRFYVDSEGGLYQTTRDALGRPLDTILPGGVASHVSYFDEVNLVETRDASGLKTQYIYDDAGRLVEVREFPDGSNAVSTHYVYDRSGNLLQVTDPKGAVTHHGYDRFSAMTQTTFPDSKTEVYEYFDDGALYSKTARDQSEWTYGYDDLGRIDTITEASATLLDYAYDRNGNVLGVDRAGTVVTYGYDERDRQTSESLSIAGGGSYGLTTVYTASGLVDYIDYPDSFRADYAYDDRGRAQMVTWTEGAMQDSVALVHDNADRLAGTVHGSGDSALRAQYRRNDRGQVTDLQVYQGTVSSWQQDLAPVVDVQALWDSCPDDGLPHFTKVDDSEPEGDGDVTYVYTGNNLWKDEYGIADMGSLAPGEQITWVEVAAVARVATKESSEIRLRFLVNGQAYPTDPSSAFVLSSEYETFSLRFPTQPGSALGIPWTKSAVDAISVGVESWFGLGAKGQIRVTRLSATVKVDGDASYHMQLHLDRGASGQLASVEDELRGTVENYDYDGVGRVVDVDGRWDIDYTYDDAGNRVEMTECDPECLTTQYTYPQGKYNRLTRYGPEGGPYTQFAYDDNGAVRNRLDPSGSGASHFWEFGYDELGSLEQLKLDDNVVAEYVSDGLGRRVQVDEGSVREVVFFLDQPLYENVPATGWERHHVYAGGVRIATVGTDGTAFHFGDILGSTRLVMDYDSGTYTKTYEAAWKPFGVEELLVGDSSFKYLGKESPDDAGLYTFGDRQYDPRVGRFYALDPVLGSLSTPQTLNRYAYAVNDPLVLSDPSGESADCAEYPDEEGLGIWDQANPHHFGSRQRCEVAVQFAEENGDLFALFLGFIPGLDIFSDLYFLQKDCGAGDWAMCGLDIGLVLLPVVSAAWFRAGARATGLVPWGGTDDAARGMARGAGRMVDHHTVPTAVLRHLEEVAPEVARHPLVRGVAGHPNRWAIPEDFHHLIHSGPGRGGRYNTAWWEALGAIEKRSGHVTVNDVLAIRSRLVQEFGLLPYAPKGYLP